MASPNSPRRRRPASRAMAFVHQSWPVATSFVLLLAVWQAAAMWGYLDPFVLPAPSDIGDQLFFGLSSGLYITHLGVTLAQALLGFAVALALGVGLGAFVARSLLIERTLHPFLVAFQSMPKIALAPLVIVWFGYGMGSKIVLAAVIAFFPILVSTIVGLKSAEPGRIDVMRALGASEGQIFRMVRLPGALPHILAGVNVAAVLVLLGSIVGEFVGAKNGLGTLILYATQNLEIAQVFSILAVLALVGIALHFGVSALRRRLLFWVDTRDHLPEA